MASKKQTKKRTTPTDVGVSRAKVVVPDAEMLRRDDLSNQRWTVASSTETGGLAMTNTQKREMFVPTYDDEHSRHIRARQMFVARVSPTEKQMEKWVARGHAHERTLRACEQLRITAMMKRAGFQPEEHSQNGDEEHRATVLATNGDFASTLLGAVATAGTLGGKKFIAAVAKHQPSWVGRIRNIQNEAECFFHDVADEAERQEGRGWSSLPPINSTHSTVTKSGFGYTETLARWVEQMSGAITDEIEKGGKEGDEEQEKSGEKKKSGNANKMVKEAGKNLRSSKVYRRGSTSRSSRGSEWEQLRISKPILTRSVVGAIGKKRIASPTGRNPRRITRLLTDPERRIFDRTVRGAGGVVLVDTSGSMSLSHDEVRAIVENSPSALVAQYSGGSRVKPNLYVIANKGRMVDKMPRPNGGNCMDLPALKWAVAQRQTRNAPVIWVSDGGVTGVRDGWYNNLTMDCIDLCRKEGVYVVPTPDDAIALLRKLSRREKVTSIVPEMLANAYREVTGHELTLR